MHLHAGRATRGLCIQTTAVLYNYAVSAGVSLETAAPGHLFFGFSGGGVVLPIPGGRKPL